MLSDPRRVKRVIHGTNGYDQDVIGDLHRRSNPQAPLRSDKALLLNRLCVSMPRAHLKSVILILRKVPERFVVSRSHDLRIAR